MRQRALGRARVGGDWAAWVVVVGLLSGLAVLPVSGPPALAQVEDAGRPENGGEDEELGLAGGSPAGIESGAGDGGRRPSSEGRPRTLLDIVKEGGFVGLLIILLSLIATGFIVEHLLTIRKGKLLPEGVLDELEQRIARGEIDQAMQYCDLRENESLAADVIRAGLQRFQSSEFGFAEYKSAVEEAGEDHTGRLYRKTDVLGVIGAIAPMLGLTGTVLGMIKAFNKIAEKGGMARPDELADGIGQALVTTLMGLIVAIPAMVAYSYFRNRIDSLVSEGGKRIEQVMAPLGRRR